MTEGAARRAAERTARESYGKLVAILAARSRDVAGAEDALAEAFRAALQTWPQRGVPDRPEAWLITAARRVLGHGARHGAVRAAAAATLLLQQPTMDDGEAEMIPDERLTLMFVCAHPAIDPAIQAPLMLQTVLGLDSGRIAACFLVAPATMAQRLVRAKAKIRDAGIAFSVPEAAELAPRLDAVLVAIYAAYGTGWEDAVGADPRLKGLAEEAIWLCRVLLALLPCEAEVRGLLALMLYCEARRPARRDAEGEFVPLGQQDVRLWSARMIEEAEQLLAVAARRSAPGRFQIEAAIQSVHVQRARTGDSAMPALGTALVALYGLLAQVSPTPGVLVAQAAAVAESGSPEQALLLLDAVVEPADYQPWWACRARVLQLLGRDEEADGAFTRAAGLTTDPAVRGHLLRQRQAG